MELTTENIEKAVTLFYMAEGDQRTEAHKWLNEAQNTPNAWSFVWELLSPHRSQEVQFFAATTLHMKLMKYWNELPEDHYEILKKKILEAIVNYATGPKIVLNRLCISLSAYIIHTLPNFWPKAFEELVSSFQPQHLPNVEPERVIWILLEILTVIPEEFQSTVLSTSQRNLVKSILQDVSKDIIKVVTMCLLPLPSAGFDMINLTTYVNASRCAFAWLHLEGLNIEECANISEILIDLIYFVYWNRADPECLLPEEIEIIEVAIEALTAIIQHPNAGRYRNQVIKFCVSMLYKFEKILNAERCSPDPNKDIVGNLYGLITKLAESHSKIFIEILQTGTTEEKKVAFDVISSVLKCTDFPGAYPFDETSSLLTFGFWYTLQDDILSLKNSKYAPLLLLIKPYYRDLVSVLLRKSMYPTSDHIKWTEEDAEVFRCYRQDIADTFIYCYTVLNFEMLDILHSKLSEALEKQRSTDSPHVSNEIETCLHAHKALGEWIDIEDLYLPKLMLTIKEIPYDRLNVKVLASALETVGSYCQWLTERPEQLAHVIPFICSSLNNPEVSTSTTMALKDVTNACQKYILPYADLILLSAQSVLLTGSLKLSEHRRLMVSIGKVLSMLPFNKNMDYLNIILGPLFDELQKLASSEISSMARVSICTKLKILTTIFGALFIQNEGPEGESQQPTLMIIQNTMPLYKLIADKYCRDVEVMEELSLLFKSAITTLLDYSKPFISDVLQMLVLIYREHPQPNILVLGKTVIIIFGKDPDFYETCQQVVNEIVNITLQLCSEYSNNNALSEKADVLDGFFSTLSQLIKKLPQLFANGSISTTALFQCAILTLALQEPQTLKSCSSFLVNFVTQSRDISQADVIQSYGEGLVLRILLNLNTTSPRYCVDFFSDIILALNKKYCDNLSRWLNMLLAQENFPSNKVTSTQKENFIRAVLREKANKRRLSEIVLEFTLMCRGILKDDNTLP